MRVRVSLLAKIWNPYEQPLWTTKLLSREAVALALKEDRLNSKPYVTNLLKRPKPMQYHAERVAYFVKNGWTDEICVEVGIPVLGYYVEPFVDDGNHRLAAAIFRNDEYIKIGISGQMSVANKLFREKKLANKLFREKKLAEKEKRSLGREVTS